jgi:hypothetical protein
VDGHGTDAVLGQARHEGIELDRWLRPTTPGGRVVGPDLDGVRPDSVGSLDGPDHARGEREVRADRAAVEWHPRHRTMPSMDEEQAADAALTARTLRAFIRDGRLTTIPAREKRRLIVYRYLRDQVFTEDRDYPEAEVNQRLALFHRDVATIRRGMVDAGLVTRDAGRYRRGI